MTRSIQPRKQRKALHQGPLHHRGKQISAHLSEELLVKYGKRSTTMRVGDTVKVMRGSQAGHTGEVMSVNRTDFTITIEGVTVKKADGKERPKPIHPSNVLLTKLVMTDAKRRAKLGASEAESEPKPAKAAAKPAAKPAAPKPAAAKADKPAPQGGSAPTPQEEGSS